MTQDRCLACAEHTRGSEMVLDAPDGSPMCVAHVESHFGLFKDGVSVRAR
jgi:hypothetical protein